MTARARGLFGIGLGAALLLVAFLWGMGLPPFRPRTPPPPANVVVVLIDTLRPDHLGLRGHPREMGSFLTELASSSAVLTGASSTSSWTAPSTASLFTSLSPPRHGVIVGFYAHQALARRQADARPDSLVLNRLPDAIETLPELFRRAGYTTMGLSANINIGEEMGFDRGFDRFERHHQATAEELAERLATWTDELRAGAPWLLYLHLNDVHEPYHAREPWYWPSEDRLEDRRNRYLSEIGYVDRMLRSVYEELGRGQDTVFVVLSDHGEEFRDHGGLGHGPRLYEELTRILLLIHAPGRGVAPAVVTPNVSILDVLPTLLDLAGLPPTPGREGLSLASVLRGDPGAAELAAHLLERPCYGHRMGPEGPERALWSVLAGPWKLIENLDGRRELYDHREDPHELRDRIDDEPEVTARLGALLERFQNEGAAAPAERIQLLPDEELLEHLRALGYVH